MNQPRIAKSVEPLSDPPRLPQRHTSINFAAATDNSRRLNRRIASGRMRSVTDIRSSVRYNTAVVTMLADYTAGRYTPALN